MSFPKFAPFLAAVAAPLLLSCGPAVDTTRMPVAVASPSASDSSLTGRVERSLNRYRASIGKSAIPRHAGLDRLAREHCVFMARNRGKFSLRGKNISHYGFDGRALVAQRRYGMQSVAENVAGGVIQGEIGPQLVKAWTGSKEHAYNLRQDWGATGLGVHVTDDGMVYAVQIFATRANSRMATMDRFRQF